MNHIYSFCCCQSSMLILLDLKKEKASSSQQKGKYLESSTKIQLPDDFMDQLEEAVNQNCAFTVDRKIGGYMSQGVIKAEFEVD